LELVFFLLVSKIDRGLIEMKVILAIIMALLTTSVAARAQTAPASPPSSIMAASNSIRILSPTVDQKIGTSAVTVRYQMTDAGASAAPSPTYRVQLDSRDPAETLDTSYTFTGLPPGPHVFVVELVDANHVVIGGSRAIVHFKTYTAGANPAPSQTTGALAPPAVIKANLPLPDPRAAEQLPTAGGELPLLSLIGFGVLVGGVVSAMRGRK
jgi:hypothetical protein